MSDSVVTIRKDTGSGRPFVILYEKGKYLEYAEGLLGVLSLHTRVVLCESYYVGNDNWEDLTQSLLVCLGEKEIRHASFVSFGACSTLVHNLCLHEPKMVRTIVWVDATYRPHPSILSRWIDWLEQKLPLGLPLRSRVKGFDAKPFLHRVRCPVLVVTSSKASAHVRFKAQDFVSHLPSGWVISIGNDSQNNEIANLAQIVVDFQEVPARCPQTRLRP